MRNSTVDSRFTTCGRQRTRLAVKPTICGPRKHWWTMVWRQQLWNDVAVWTEYAVFLGMPPSRRINLKQRAELGINDSVVINNAGGIITSGLRAIRRNCGPSWAFVLAAFAPLRSSVTAKMAVPFWKNVVVTCVQGLVSFKQPLLRHSNSCAWHQT